MKPGDCFTKHLKVYFFLSNIQVYMGCKNILTFKCCERKQAPDSDEVATQTDSLLLHVVSIQVTVASACFAKKRRKE